MPKKIAEKTVSIGKRIKKVRTDKNISLEQIANETGCAVDYLKDIESGKVIPPVGALLQIAKAMQIDSGLFLKEHQEKLKDRVKAYTSRTDNYAYTTLTPGAENKHLKAFRVTIEPNQAHVGVGYCHEGEEFVYVLAGSIDITVGDHVNHLKTDDSLHFNSGIRHQLTNVGDERAELIVVIYGA